MVEDPVTAEVCAMVVCPWARAARAAATAAVAEPGTGKPVPLGDPSFASIRRCGHREPPLLKLLFQANPGTELSGTLRSMVAARRHVGPVFGVATSLRVHADIEGVVGTVLTGPTMGLIDAKGGLVTA
mmetsp:Transcript_50530/g.134398  ORF Transcript_50530/g.134398 Transcript_50530/m.134398 type:complete len:128 (-) Transcript_50530:1709-2092(-)